MQELPDNSLNEYPPMSHHNLKKESSPPLSQKSFERGRHSMPNMVDREPNLIGAD